MPKTTRTSAGALIIDTDGAVEDLIAIAYLLGQRRRTVDILGVVTVAGATTPDHAANSVLGLLDIAQAPPVPVVVGAAAPLARRASHSGRLIYGQDGLWGASVARPHDLSPLARDAPAFYRDALAAHPGATIVTLGPLTNLAATIGRYPEALAGAGKVIVLGGARAGGTQTPVSEYNIWQDPEAAKIVFSHGLPIDLITRDAFKTVTATNADIAALKASGNPLARFVAAPLERLFQVQTGAGSGGGSATGLADVAAVLYALEPDLAASREAGLVEIISDPAMVRGQTVIGLRFAEKLMMLADDDELSAIADQFTADPEFDLFGALGAILGRRPDNANVILDVNERRMKQLLMRALTAAARPVAAS